MEHVSLVQGTVPFWCSAFGLTCVTGLFSWLLLTAKILRMMAEVLFSIRKLW